MLLHQPLQSHVHVWTLSDFGSWDFLWIKFLVDNKINIEYHLFLIRTCFLSMTIYNNLWWNLLIVVVSVVFFLSFSVTSYSIIS